ncbi:MAG: DUF4160 domain-containing protein [Anaerolineae bacterium]
MPTIWKSGPYRIYCYSHDLQNEPPHVHVDRENLSAKFWLSPVALARNLGFSPFELRRIERLLQGHQRELLEKWHASFGY